MADFQVAYQSTNGTEGGWQNDPDDTGNAFNGLGTYRGMASAKQPKWKGWPIIKAAISALPPQPKYDTALYRAWVKQLNSVLAANTELQELLADYYRANFWDVNRLGELSDQTLANHVYDHGINRGVGTAAMLLQKVLGVMRDGQIGPVTVKAANADKGAAERYREARRADYENLITKNPHLAQYRRTWMSRC